MLLNYGCSCFSQFMVLILGRRDHRSTYPSWTIPSFMDLEDKRTVSADTDHDVECSDDHDDDDDEDEREVFAYE